MLTLLLLLWIKYDLNHKNTFDIYLKYFWLSKTFKSDIRWGTGTLTNILFARICIHVCMDACMQILCKYTLLMYIYIILWIDMYMYICAKTVYTTGYFMNVCIYVSISYYYKYYFHWVYAFSLLSFFLFRVKVKLIMYHFFFL